MDFLNTLEKENKEKHKVYAMGEWGRPKMKVKLDPGATMPSRAHEWDGGLDIYAAEDKVVFANNYESIETGTHIAIPEGYVGLLTSKSGIMLDHGATCRGTIDSGYTGSIKAIVINHGNHMLLVKAGQKIAQLVIVPCLRPELELVDELEPTERGDNGFGSTGV